MHPTSRQDPRVIRPLGRHDADRVLVCLGFCGGGTGAYRRWTDWVDDDTDLALVCYPGREGRFCEPFAGSWDELVDDTTETVLSVVDRPYVLFGHSMGGWMAYSVTTRIEHRGPTAPDRLIVSSCNAPNRGLTERDRFPRDDDTDHRLLSWMRTTGSLPEYVLGDPDLREMSLELMRADIGVRDTYRPEHGLRTGVDVQVLHGARDEVIDPGVAEQWAAVTAGRCHVDELPGGHFYTEEIWQSLPRHFRLPATVAD
ncbi:thioesterase II family protein [Nocardiopsis quinghaiensis]|uniref:thioesterase II family protein n=1 Tax=Nocardiopsis quinghaiensis TaxID=464995 RepID=UPI001CC255C9|nr:alpha/beta fold hydrolase [Nocardiopsis quinghaiensis]